MVCYISIHFIPMRTGGFQSGIFIKWFVQGILLQYHSTFHSTLKGIEHK